MKYKEKKRSKEVFIKWLEYKKNKAEKENRFETLNNYKIRTAIAKSKKNFFKIRTVTHMNFREQIIKVDDKIFVIDWI